MQVIDFAILGVVLGTAIFFLRLAVRSRRKKKFAVPVEDEVTAFTKYLDNL